MKKSLLLHFLTLINVYKYLFLNANEITTKYLRKGRLIAYNQPNITCLSDCNNQVPPTDDILMNVNFCGTDYNSYSSEYSTSFSDYCYGICGLMTRYQGSWYILFRKK